MRMLLDLTRELIHGIARDDMTGLLGQLSHYMPL
jgi:hypothetical protein